MNIQSGENLKIFPYLHSPAAYSRKDGKQLVKALWLLKFLPVLKQGLTPWWGVKRTSQHTDQKKQWISLLTAEPIDLQLTSRTKVLLVTNNCSSKVPTLWQQAKKLSQPFITAEPMKILQIYTNTWGTCKNSDTQHLFSYTSAETCWNTVFRYDLEHAIVLSRMHHIYYCAKHYTYSLPKNIFELKQ